MHWDYPRRISWATGCSSSRTVKAVALGGKLDETEISQRGGEACDVGLGAIDEDVEVLCRPRSTVCGEGVRAHDQEAHPLRVQQTDNLAPIGRERRHRFQECAASMPRRRRHVRMGSRSASDEPLRRSPRPAWSSGTPSAWKEYRGRRPPSQQAEPLRTVTQTARSSPKPGA